MPNWEELVRQRLSGLDVDVEEAEEIQAEIAAHLEEAYEALCGEGLRAEEATQRTLAQVSDWKDLRRKILIARRKEPMQKRTQQLWIPGILTFILSTSFLMALQRFGFHPRLVGNGANAILFYAPWLASLPCFGAFGAYLSARRGGSVGTALVASVFPVLGLTATFVLMFPIGFVVEQILGMPVDFGNVATEMLRDGTDWIAVPGLALLAGGILSQFLANRKTSSREALVV